MRLARIAEACGRGARSAGSPTQVQQLLSHAVRAPRARCMRYNKLGESGLLVSELSYGAWVTFQVSTSQTESERLSSHRRT